MPQNTRVTLDGKEYIWTGKEWCDAHSFLIPPQLIVGRLNEILEQELRNEDMAIRDVQVLVQRASILRDAQQFGRAERLIRNALQLFPGNYAAVAVLSSILRAHGLPQEALDQTEAYKHESNAPLLTSRAAALCDLKRWEDAKREVGRALAIKQSEEAFGVVRRIKSERPDLYS